MSLERRTWRLGDHAKQARRYWSARSRSRSGRTGRDHAQVAITLTNLGPVADGDLGDHFAEAERDTLERALATGERAYGPDHVELASSPSLWNLYEANRALGDTATKQREHL